MLEDLLDALQSDFQLRPLPDLIRRDVRIPRIERKAVTLIGMRRVGKTYVLFDQMRRLLESGVPKQHLFYLNLEDDRLGAPTVATLDCALERFYRRSPEARRTKARLFLDEIQAVPGWEKFLRRVIDTEDVEITLTGSSARLLSTEVATSFRGRGLAVEVLPFCLREAARAHAVEPGDCWPPAAPVRSLLAALLDDHLLRGGFPEIQRAHAFDRVSVLQQYVDLVLLKDVGERFAVQNLLALKHLVRGLFAANAGPFSVSRFHGTLVSQGIKVGKPTLLSYLEHLRDACLLFLVPLRSRSAKQRMVNPRKVYAIDTGMAAAMRVGGARDMGALLENFVYLEFRRELQRAADELITYYRTASGYEVDFAIDSVVPDEGLRLVQVSTSLEDPATREREVRALAEAMAETGVPEGTIITLTGREIIETKAGPIRVVPAWEWAFSCARRAG